MLTYDVIREVALGAVLPTAAASGALFHALQRWRPAAAAPAAALALAGGFLLGNWLRGAVGLREDSADLHHVLYTGGAVVVAGLLARAPRLPPVLGWAMRAVAAALAAWWLVGLVPGEAPPRAWPVAVMMFSAWGLCEQASREPAGGAGPLALALASMGASVVLLAAYSARMAEAAVLLGSALGGLALVASARRVDAGAAVPGGVVMLAGLLLVGHGTTDSEVPAWCFLLVGAAPLALGPTLTSPVRRLAGPRLGLLRVAAVLTPLAVAVARAIRAAPTDW